jgi:putative membrane protein
LVALPSQREGQQQGKPQPEDGNEDRVAGSPRHPSRGGHPPRATQVVREAPFTLTPPDVPALLPSGTSRTYYSLPTLEKTGLILESVADTPTRAGGPERTADSRVFQANERTLLAWIRTAIGLLAFGFVLERVDGWVGAPAPGGVALERSAGAAWIGAGFVVLGLLANALAILRFARSRRALRTGAPLPTDVFPIAFAAALTVLGATLAIYVIARIA